MDKKMTSGEIAKKAGESQDIREVLEKQLSIMEEKRNQLNKVINMVRRMVAIYPLPFLILKSGFSYRKQSEKNCLPFCKIIFQE